jgi:RNA polymerase sigma-70 factor (ECF subfamily)
MGVPAIATAVPAPPENEAVRRACAGDLPAFEEIYRSHVGRIYGLCLRMTGNPHRAEEQTQETFVRAWQKLGTFRGGPAFPAWLRRVAVNVVLGERRSRGRRPEDDRPFEDPAEFGQIARETPDSALDLERAIAALPAGARQVFVLHQIEGYRHEEIARMMNVTSGTTKAQLHRARKLLMEALQ